MCRHITTYPEHHFFRLFSLIPPQTYSCAYFERDDMTLEEAQIAKIDLTLGKLGLQPGMMLLDVGCGWGATMRGVEFGKCDVNVVGLTLSENQAVHVRKFVRRDGQPTRQAGAAGRVGSVQVSRSTGSRSIGAFEHFGHDRYSDFFKMAHAVLPADGVMLLHTITALTQRGARGQRAAHSVSRWSASPSSCSPRDLPGRPVAVDRHGGGPLSEGGFHAVPPPAAAAALREDPGSVGSGAKRHIGRKPSRFSPKRSTSGT